MKNPWKKMMFQNNQYFPMGYTGADYNPEAEECNESDDERDL
jgi:hypothetical protein